MEKHFVEKYLGEYYFSSQDKDTIQGVGEESGNGDTILFTFNEEDENEPLNSLSEYFSRNLVFTKDELIEKLYACNIEQIGVYAAITEVTCNAIYDIDTNKDILKTLLDDNTISKEMYDDVVKILNEKLNKQLEFIKNVDKISLNVIINRKKEKKKEN